MNRTFIHKHLPYVEVVYNQIINGCPKSHIHDKVTFTAIINGSLQLKSDKEYLLQRGVVAVINPFQTHFVPKNLQNNQHLYSLYLDKEWVEEIQKRVLFTKVFLPFSTNLITDRDLYTNYIQVCQNLLSNSTYKEKEKLLIHFVEEMVSSYCTFTHTPYPNTLQKEIQEYIDKNFLQINSLQELAQEFLITPKQIIKIFKKEMKLTPHQYILNKKLHLAKELLKTEHSITQVALLAGFSDQSHLYKYFKELFSISPKEYQKSI